MNNHRQKNMDHHHQVLAQDHVKELDLVDVNYHGKCLKMYKDVDLENNLCWINPHHQERQKILVIMDINWLHFVVKVIGLVLIQ